MALEGLTLDEIASLEATLLERVPISGNIGNMALISALGWQGEGHYWDVRNRLIERGLLVQGRGRGGSVRRPLLDSAIVLDEPTPPEVADDSEGDAATREADLYLPMAEVIRSRWAKEHRLDSLLVEVTAAQGSRQTKGKWTRPDITVASYNTFPYVPGRHFDVITFEIKPSTMLDVTVVYEALGHRRASTRAYALLHVPEHAEAMFEGVIEDICAEAKRHGIGVVIAAQPDDYDTWEEKVEAVRHEPDPERLNEFLAVQMSQGFREQIIKWFK